MMDKLGWELRFNAIRKGLAMARPEFESSDFRPAARRNVDVLNIAIEKLRALDFEIRRSGRVPESWSEANRDDPYAALFVSIAKLEAELVLEKYQLRLHSEAQEYGEESTIHERESTSR